ncbi:ABC transporter permease [Novosphingobium marinum]|uniref:ABC-2 type transport system permease protein n=1 Tax=Novosphingobium marinum TaxID=1514948 RepID=A0A7Y9XXA7_9SPHN|nr:ABC transporter permease [Novosphingobium marinum]NYH96326.1 ABC-2 type transport system permease protein [Novosphingobium marinum]GGC34357.1 ABC transporter permease [Novosphingobium marinum]
MINSRLRAIIVKEIWAIIRDPRARILLIAPPVVQLFLFGFASTMEVDNIRIGVLDLDGGRWSREVIERIGGSPNVAEVRLLRSDAEMRDAIDRQEVIAALRFPPQFSADVAAGRGGVIGGVFDGRRSNAAQIVSSYVQTIAGEVGATAVPMRAPPGGQSIVRNFFNPTLEDQWFVLPALVAILASVSVLPTVSQSVARERELGTFDQLMVSPLRTYEMLTGKMIPPMIIGFVNVTAFMIILPLVFGVPLTGSLVPFYLALIVYLAALSGLGMLVSVLSSTQQQAFLGIFVVINPLIILSGYASPVDNMPGWMQGVAATNPVMWFLKISEGTFLMAMPASEVLANTWPIAIIAAVTITLSAVLFRQRME